MERGRKRIYKGEKRDRKMKEEDEQRGGRDREKKKKEEDIRTKRKKM